MTIYFVVVIVIVSRPPSDPPQPPLKPLWNDCSHTQKPGELEQCNCVRPPSDPLGMTDFAVQAGGVGAVQSGQLGGGEGAAPRVYREGAARALGSIIVGLSAAITP